MSKQSVSEYRNRFNINRMMADIQNRSIDMSSNSESKSSNVGFIKSSNCIINIDYVVQEEKISFEVFRKSVNSNCLYRKKFCLRQSKSCCELNSADSIQLPDFKNSSIVQTGQEYVVASMLTTNNLGPPPFDRNQKAIECPVKENYIPHDILYKESYGVSNFKFPETTNMVKMQNSNFCCLDFDGTRSHKRNHSQQRTKNKRTINIKHVQSDVNIKNKSRNMSPSPVIPISPSPFRPISPSPFRPREKVTVERVYEIKKSPDNNAEHREKINDETKKKHRVVEDSSDQTIKLRKKDHAAFEFILAPKGEVEKTDNKNKHAKERKYKHRKIIVTSNTLQPSFKPDMKDEEQQINVSDFMNKGIDINYKSVNIEKLIDSGNRYRRQEKLKKKLTISVFPVLHIKGSQHSVEIPVINVVNKRPTIPRRRIDAAAVVSPVIENHQTDMQSLNGGHDTIPNKRKEKPKKSLHLGENGKVNSMEEESVLKEKVANLIKDENPANKKAIEELYSLITSLVKEKSPTPLKSKTTPKLQKEANTHNDFVKIYNQKDAISEDTSKQNVVRHETLNIGKKITGKNSMARMATHPLSIMPDPKKIVQIANDFKEVPSKEEHVSFSNASDLPKDSGKTDGKTKKIRDSKIPKPGYVQNSTFLSTRQLQSNTNSSFRKRKEYSNTLKNKMKNKLESSDLDNESNSMSNVTSQDKISEGNKESNHGMNFKKTSGHTSKSKIPLLKQPSKKQISPKDSILKTKKEIDTMFPYEFSPQKLKEENNSITYSLEAYNAPTSNEKKFSTHKNTSKKDVKLQKLKEENNSTTYSLEAYNASTSNEEKFSTHKNTSKKDVKQHFLKAYPLELNSTPPNSLPRSVKVSEKNDTAYNLSKKNNVSKIPGTLPSILESEHSNEKLKSDDFGKCIVLQEYTPREHKMKTKETIKRVHSPNKLNKSKSKKYSYAPNTAGKLIFTRLSNKTIHLHRSSNRFSKIIGSEISCSNPRINFKKRSGQTSKSRIPLLKQPSKKELNGFSKCIGSKMNSSNILNKQATRPKKLNSDLFVTKQINKNNRFLVYQSTKSTECKHINNEDYSPRHVEFKHQEDSVTTTHKPKREEYARKPYNHEHREENYSRKPIDFKYQTEGDETCILGKTCGFICCADSHHANDSSEIDITGIQRFKNRSSRTESPRTVENLPSTSKQINKNNSHLVYYSSKYVDNRYIGDQQPPVLSDLVKVCKYFCCHDHRPIREESDFLLPKDTEVVAPPKIQPTIIRSTKVDESGYQPTIIRPRTAIPKTKNKPSTYSPNIIRPVTVTRPVTQIEAHPIEHRHPLWNLLPHKTQHSEKNYKDLFLSTNFNVPFEITPKKSLKNQEDFEISTDTIAELIKNKSVVSENEEDVTITCDSLLLIKEENKKEQNKNDFPTKVKETPIDVIMEKCSMKSSIKSDFDSKYSELDMVTKTNDISEKSSSVLNVKKSLSHKYLRKLKFDSFTTFLWKKTKAFKKNFIKKEK